MAEAHTQEQAAVEFEAGKAAAACPCAPGAPASGHGASASSTSSATASAAAGHMHGAPAVAAAAATPGTCAPTGSRDKLIKRSQSSVVLYVPLPIQKVWDIVSDFFGERHGWPTQVNITPLTQTSSGLTAGARKRVEDKADPAQVWVIERLVAVNAQEYWYTYTVDECTAQGTSYDGLLQLFPEYSRAPADASDPVRTRVVWSYALLPLEGEQVVPRARMERVRRTLVAYLMGLQHLAYGLGGAADDTDDAHGADTTSSDSDVDTATSSDDDRDAAVMHQVQVLTCSSTSSCYSRVTLATLPLGQAASWNSKEACPAGAVANGDTTTACQQDLQSAALDVKDQNEEIQPATVSHDVAAAVGDVLHSELDHHTQVVDLELPAACGDGREHMASHDFEAAGAAAGAEHKAGRAPIDGQEGDPITQDIHGLDVAQAVAKLVTVTPEHNIQGDTR